MSHRKRPYASKTADKRPSGRSRLIIALAVLLIASHTGIAQRPKGSRPYVLRQGKNLVSNAAVANDTEWSLFGDAKYDAGTSRTPDGSGSFLLTTSVFKEEGSKVFSDTALLFFTTSWTFMFDNSALFGKGGGEIINPLLQ